MNIVGPPERPDIEQAKAYIAKVLDGVPPETARSALKKVQEKFDIDEAMKRIEELKNNVALSDAEKRHIAAPILAIAEDERYKLGADLTKLHWRSEQCKNFLRCLEELQAWFNRGYPKLVLESNECSRLHKIKHAMEHGRLIDGGDRDNPAPVSAVFMRSEHTFVVKHDWASAFERSDVIGAEFKLPYELCAFEFRLSGRTFILWCQELDSVQSFTSFIEVGDHWYCPPEIVGCESWAKYLWDQVRAICIALDAEVATHAVVRAPHKLNEKREKHGKPKLLDFHIVDLAKRHRVANPSGTTGGGGQKRLHFRRGHWRHFETSKTWVKWCLVGNPDLGFIQKSYKL